MNTRSSISDRRLYVNSKPSVSKDWQILIFNRWLSEKEWTPVLKGDLTVSWYLSGCRGWTSVGDKAQRRNMVVLRVTMWTTQHQAASGALVTRSPLEMTWLLVRPTHKNRIYFRLFYKEDCSLLYMWQHWCCVWLHNVKKKHAGETPAFWLKVQCFTVWDNFTDFNYM